jgi:hypothetical protein
MDPGSTVDIAQHLRKNQELNQKSYGKRFRLSSPATTADEFGLAGDASAESVL